MRIKQPYSDNAFKSLMGEIDHVQSKLTNCVSNSHNITAVLYFSSYIIMPDVIFKGKKLLQEILKTINISPNCICVVRTTTPTYFKGRMRILQKKSVDSLRKKCYVMLYTKNKEFLNHAKFFVHYHICQSEGNVHYGHYFGSTNLTQVGLGNPNNKGNYEEFDAYHNIKYSLSGSDKEYLKEVLELIMHKASLYTDTHYLKEYILDHERLLDNLLSRVKFSDETSGLSLGRIYENYVNLMTAYNATFALLDEIPGKRITDRIMETMAKGMQPLDPLELEMMNVTAENSESTRIDLDLNEGSLRDLCGESGGVLGKGLAALRSEYEPFVERISEYLDEGEIEFLELLRTRTEKHINSLQKIIVGSDW